MMIFILGFLVCYLAFAKSKNYLMFFLALAFANLSLYYKEPAFIIVATFSFFHLIFTWNSLSTREKLLDVALIASAIIFLALYVIIMLPKQASVLYTFSTDGQLFSHARNVINYALFSDPVPLLLVCPLALWRIYVIAKRIDSPHGILDPLLFAGAAYTVGHLILNIYAPYYLFPVWVMGVPPALYFYSKTRRNIGLFWKAMAYMVAAIFVLNAIPLTAHTLTYDKYLAINFDQTINFLAHDIKQRHADERVNVFLDGVNREAGRGTYFVFGEYLKYKGLSVRDFNLCSTDKRESLLPLQTKPSPFDKKNEIDELSDKFGYPNKFFPYSVMQPGGATDIQKNDYLIVTPQSPNDVDQKYVAELERNYDLLFHTSSRFAVPNVGAKALVKMLISRFLGEEQSKTVMHTRNIMDWPNYYVFVKR